MPSKDELARTATSPGTSTPKPAPVLGETLGRYRLERELGAGGMGVVHAAFDPDLERRVALKVLRDDHGGGDARQRLLREARAMARLTHANVVTVHEVGSANGRDYVAMELIDGATLADWLRDAEHSPEEIVAAFIAAGRGLAAAHAAKLVHRDFKPHNVLRGGDGRIVVTDFGLARGVDPTASAVALETTLQQGRKPVSEQSSLSGLTATGSVLGTPAYMAPEQWTGGIVGPAADQFAFCVALWEALTGQRPFEAATMDELKQAVARGPADLDMSKLPRRLREPLLRGLDPDPARRWPSMDALLVALDRRTTRTWLFVAGVASLAVAGAVMYFALHGGDDRVACAGPALDPALAWPADAGGALRAAGRGDIAALFEHDIAAWRRDREHACSAATPHGPQLVCLDAVLARFDAVHRAVGRVTGDLPADSVGEWLVDPTVCAMPVPPRLVLHSSPETDAALALALDVERKDTKVTEQVATAFAGKSGLDACTHAIALLVVNAATKDVPRSRAAIAEAVTATEICGDDRLRADVLLEAAPFEYEVPNIGPKGEAAIMKAKAAIDRVAQPDLVATLDLQRATVARQQRRWPEAFAAVEHAIAGFGERGRTRSQVAAAMAEIGLRFTRSDVADVDAVRVAVAKWKPIAAAGHDQQQVTDLERSDAFARWYLEDNRGPHDELLKLWHPEPIEGLPAGKIDGTVVDGAGKPVAGATVAAAPLLFFDAYGPLPVQDRGALRIMTTDAAGHFEIADAARTGAMIAQLDNQRSAALPIQPHSRLVLAPARRIEGKADLGSVAHTNAFAMIEPVGIKTDAYRIIVPIAADGSFAIDGAPVGKLQIGVSTRNGQDLGTADMIQLPASPGPDRGVRIAVTTSTRTVDVITRSTVALAIDTAQVLLLTGHQPIKSVQELVSQTQVGGERVQFARPVVGEAIPKAAIGKFQPGDLVAHFTNIAAGDLTVCVIGLNGDMTDPVFARKVQAHVSELQLKCVFLGADDNVIVVEAPPQKRFD